MTRPMTGQPQTEDEMTKNTQRANAEISEMLENGEITRGFDDEDDEDDKMDELKEFRKTAREQGNDKIGAYGEPQTDDKDEDVVVTEGGETHTLTREEFESERGGRSGRRTYRRLLRHEGATHVELAFWFDDKDVNKVSHGNTFTGFKVGETEKAIQFEVPPNLGNHNAGTERVWVPKSAARTYELTN